MLGQIRNAQKENGKVDTIFVADFFADTYVGGAELTTEAILERSPCPITKMQCKNLNAQFVLENKNKKWIFGNFANIDMGLLLYFMAQDIDYSIIEYDYKYCQYRTPQLHKQYQGQCCEYSPRAQLIFSFFLNAKSIWYMSHAQKQWYENACGSLTQTNSHVLSSVFDKKSLEQLSSLDCTNKNELFLIQKHTNPAKGTEASLAYAKSNNLDYELFSDLTHEELLHKFSTYKGFICLPTDFDTCPRVAIEAKLMDCELVLNDNVQHRNEEWFQKKETIIPYMNERLEFFWKTI